MNGADFGKSVRARLGSLGERVYPNLDENAYRRARARERTVRSRQYQSVPAAHQRQIGHEQPHVVVVPYEGQEFGHWGPAEGNFYYEVTENLRDLIGQDRVSVFEVKRGTPFHQWHIELIDFLNDRRATHVITHIEADPSTEGSQWTWDSAFELMEKYWGGVLLGVMFDSAYRYINFKSRILANMSANFIVVDICMPMNSSMKLGRVEVGPVNRPMCNATMTVIDKRLSGVERVFDVSFIGVLYPYRIEMIEKLQEMGFAIAVNPHRSEAALTADASRANQPSWLDYLAGLASSQATINFSQSSAGPYEQLKWRVVEAGLAGTFLLTDDQDRTRRFWEPSTFGTFTDVNDLPTVVGEWFSKPNQLEIARDLFAQRSREIVHTHFWGSIEQGLIERDLPRINLGLK